jgi:hypothetical protein
MADGPFRDSTNCFNIAMDCRRQGDMAVQSKSVRHRIHQTENHEAGQTDKRDRAERDAENCEDLVSLRLKQPAASEDEGQKIATDAANNEATEPDHCGRPFIDDAILNLNYDQGSESHGDAESGDYGQDE